MQATNPPLTRVTLDSSTAIKLSMGNKMAKERALMERNDAWHRVKIVRGAKYDKEFVLRSILLAVEPADLIPVKYQINGEDAYFMARNCGPALEMLCRSNLIINLTNGNPIVLIVTLAFASIHKMQINIQPILLAALTKRYDKTKKYLKLDDFHRDDIVSQTVYCPLSQVRTLNHTLKLAKTALGPFEHLNLQNNELLNVRALENSNLNSLKKLDLRNNYLMSMDILMPLKSLKINELWLDGNPLCENYANAARYVVSARLYCPHLTKLDGVTLNPPDMPVNYNSYFKNDDTRKLIHQFLDHFFNIYDHEDRSLLANLYHRNAFYSLTLEVSAGCSNRMNLVAFMAENRNRMPMAPTMQGHKLLYRGPEDIVKAFKRLPLSLHERKGFKIDVMFENQQCILFNIEGVFKIPPSQLLAFSRTFLIVARENNEFNILNDQYHVDTTVPDDYPVSFDDPPVEKEISEEMSSLTPKEKERLIYTLMEATTMNTEWCHRFLDDANWNARRALRKFMDNYKSSIIPADAFSR